MTDPIADMLTRIRNAQHAHHARVDVPASKLKTRLAEILKEEGFITDFRHIEDRLQGLIEIKLKYHGHNKPVIEVVQRVSKPGRRVYVGHDEIPRVRNGLGISILTTSRGVMVDREARKQRVGGEVLCQLW